MALPAVARAQAQAPADESSGTVVVDLVGEVDPTVDEGVLVRTTGSSMAPMLAVYVGLTVLGGTLALITARRRILTVRARELATGVAAGRRGRTDFWDAQPSVAAGPAPGRTPIPKTGRIARSRPRMLVVSCETVPMVEALPSARTAPARGANDAEGNVNETRPASSLSRR